MGADKDSDELIRLIQRKRLADKLKTPELSEDAAKRAVRRRFLATLSAAVPGLGQAFEDVLAGDTAPAPLAPSAPPPASASSVYSVGAPVVALPQHNVFIGHTAVPIPGPPLTEVEVLQEIERQQKIARVRYRIRHWDNDVFSAERMYEVLCSKILWSIPVPGDREREVVQCAAGHEVTAPAPWGDGTARGDLGRFPCFIMGFSFLGQSGGLINVNWPQGFTKS